MLLAAADCGAAQRHQAWGSISPAAPRCWCCFESEDSANEGTIREVAGVCGVPDPSLVRYGETDEPEFLIRFRSDAGESESERVAGADCPLTDADRERLARAAESGGGEGAVGEKGEHRRSS